MFGLFGKNKRRKPERTIPIASYGAAAREQAEEPKAFQIALSWKGLWALIGVFFLLQMWMFLLGMWAAQTIVFPVARQPLPRIERPAQHEDKAAREQKTTTERPDSPTPRQTAPVVPPAASSEPAPVAEANLPAPTAEVPPELAGQVELGSAPPPETASAPVMGPEVPPASRASGTPPNMTDTKKRPTRTDEAMDYSEMDIPPSW